MASTIELNNVGPIEHVSIPIPDDGGIVVLRGRNGRGKTKALEAVDSAVSGRGRPDVRDGALSGSVSAFGVTIKVGRSARRSGELEVQSLEGRLSVAELVDPGIKSPDAADAKRIKALVHLSGVEPSAELFYPLLGGREQLEAVASSATLDSDDLVTMAERIKRAIESEARGAESIAENQRANSKAAREAAADVDTNDPHDGDTLQAALEAAIQDATKLEEQGRAAEDAAEAYESAQVRLDSAQADYDGPTAAHATESRQAIATRNAEAEAAVRELEQQLADARHNWDIERSALSSAIQAEKTAIAHEAAIANCRQELAAAQPATPTPESIEIARQRVAECRAAVEHGAVVRRAIKHLEAVKKCNAEVIAAEKRAAQLRDAARATDDVLSSVVAKAGTSLRVEAGRLVLDTRRGATYFADLSHGERWKLGLDAAIEAVGQGGVFTIPQEAWESLDPIARREIGEHVAGRGVVILTAEASDDEEVTAEVFA